MLLYIYIKCNCASKNKAIWDHRHWPHNLKRSKVNNARLLQACVHVFLTLTRSISAAVLILPVIIIFLKIQSAMEITKCSDNSQTTSQYFSHSCSKCFHSQSGPSSEHLQLPSTYFQLSLAF
jgi:hypothetical protein